MSSHNHINQYKVGDWYAFCMTCRRRIFGSELKINWDGKYVCDECVDEKNPIFDGIPNKTDDMVPPIVSPNPDKAQIDAIMASQDITQIGTNPQSVNYFVSDDT